MSWKITIPRNLRVVSQEVWDGTTAENEIYEWAGIDLSTNDTSKANFSKIQKGGFIFYNDLLNNIESPNITEIRDYTSYPIARIINGKPVVIREALSFALSFLNREPPNVAEGITTSQVARAVNIVNQYIDKYESQSKENSCPECKSQYVDLPYGEWLCKSCGTAFEKLAPQIKRLEKYNEKSNLKVAGLTWENS